MVDMAEAVGTVVADTSVVALAILVSETVAVATVDTAVARNLVAGIVAETVMEVLALAAIEVGS